MRRLAPVVDGFREPGLYRWRSRAHPAAINRELTTDGWYFHLLDGGRAIDRSAFFDEFARLLRFPGWFGRNWDAFADCLSDLSWLPAGGHVVLWERYGALARNDPSAWDTAREILAEKTTGPDQRIGSQSLYVLLRGDGPTEGLQLL